MANEKPGRWEAIMVQRDATRVTLGKKAGIFNRVD